MGYLGFSSRLFDDAPAKGVTGIPTTRNHGSVPKRKYSDGKQPRIDQIHRFPGDTIGSRRERRCILFELQKLHLSNDSPGTNRANLDA